MGRKFKRKNSIEIENIVAEALRRIDNEIEDEKKVALLTRLIFSGVANYFYNFPDNLINIGYIQLKKNPEKTQLFAVDLLKTESEGVVNANTLWRYYIGDLAKEAELKSVIDNFVQELLKYSQEQEEDISQLTKKLQ